MCLAVGYGVIVAPIYLAVYNNNNVHICISQEFSRVFLVGTLWLQTSERQLFLSLYIIILSNSVCTMLWLVQYVTIFWKTDHLRAFCILRNTNLKYLMHSTSLVIQYSHTRYLV